MKNEKGKNDVWIGLGESHSGDLVFAGYHNWNAKMFRLGACNPEEVEWASLCCHGFKLGGGLGGSCSGIIVFAHGVKSVSSLSSDFAWGDMDFDIALGVSLGTALKSLKVIGKIVDTLEKYNKLQYAGTELYKNHKLMNPGVYTIEIPGSGPGVHIWYGRKYSRITLIGTGKGLPSL
jgi:hypothetical protein